MDLIKLFMSIVNEQSDSEWSSSSIIRLYYYYTTPYIRAFLTFKIVITVIQSCFSS